MKPRRWLIDTALLIVVLAMAVLVFVRLSRLIKSWRGSQESQTPTATVVTSDPTATAPMAEIEPTTLPPKNTAPDFTLSDLAGNEVSLSDFQGKAVLINFWATWCPPCRAEMPLIQQAADQYADDLIVLAVNAGETEDVIRDFVQENEFTFIFLVDTRKDISRMYRALGYPTSIFVDPDGVVQMAHTGELDDALLSTYLSKIGLGE